MPRRLMRRQSDAAPSDAGAPLPPTVSILNKWVAFVSPDHLYTAQFPSPPQAGRDRKQNPTFAVQDFVSAYMIVSTASPTGVAETLADDAATGIRMKGGSISRTEKAAISGWLVRDVWFMLEVRNDGVPWYGRERILVSATSPFRIISAMAMMGLPGDEARGRVRRERSPEVVAPANTSRLPRPRRGRFEVHTHDPGCRALSDLAC